MEHQKIPIELEKEIIMSRTSTRGDSNKIKSPLKYYVRYAAEKGQFEYWDGEKAVYFDVLEMVLLDDRKCITGYNEKRKTRITSNRVQSTAKEMLRVRCGEEILAEGLYNDIKDKIVVSGGKFTNEIFAMVKIDGEFVPASIQFAGVANGCWIDFLDQSGGKYALYRSMVRATKGEHTKKGRSEFYTVAFETAQLPADLDVAANEFNDDSLQPYLNQNKAVVVEPEAAVV